MRPERLLERGHDFLTVQHLLGHSELDALMPSILSRAFRAEL